MKTETEIFKLCDKVRQVAYDLHLYLCHGHLEKVYENGLANRLRKSGVTVIQQHPLEVCDQDGAVLGNYLADLTVGDSLVIELKTCRALGEEHIAQLLGYMRAARMEHGLLINFGSPKFEIRKFILSG